jgi:hypothetical protein
VGGRDRLPECLPQAAHLGGGACYLVFQPTCGGGVSYWSTRTGITVLIVHLLSTAADSPTEVELLQIMALELAAAPPASLLVGGTAAKPRRSAGAGISPRWRSPRRRPRPGTA